MENVEGVEVHIYVNGINEEGGIFARKSNKQGSLFIRKMRTGIFCQNKHNLNTNSKWLLPRCG